MQAGACEDDEDRQHEVGKKNAQSIGERSKGERRQQQREPEGDCEADACKVGCPRRGTDGKARGSGLSGAMPSPMTNTPTIDMIAWFDPQYSAKPSAAMARAPAK
jgi:hypothetical protein